MSLLVVLLICLCCVTLALRLNSFLRMSTSMITENRLPPMSSWPEYLVEFRGLAPSMRLDELKDAAEREGITELVEGSTKNLVIMDERTQVPITLCMRLPDDECCRRITQSCATVRRIVSIWGHGRTHEEICERLAASRSQFEQYVNAGLSWRVQFGRFGREGRVGISPQAKTSLLSKLIPSLGTMQGKVNITNPELDLVFLDDCSDYEQRLKTLVAQRKAQRHIVQDRQNCHGSADSKSRISDFADASAVTELEYTPLQYLFGRVVAEGPGIVNTFALNTRPFVGTTSMNAVCAHLSASAAQVKPGQRVLDPFCGTGSLLVAAAYLGADVVGSDIEGDGLMTPSPADIAPKLRSKNVNFRRRSGEQQVGRCVLDNFVHYGLRDRVVDLFGAFVEAWLQPQAEATLLLDPEVVAKVTAYDKFDAIITDPPFGKREKAQAQAHTVSAGSRVSPGAFNPATPTSTGTLDGPQRVDDDAEKRNINPAAVLVTLFQVARQRLVRGGKLVFWLPTPSNVTEAEVREQISGLIKTAGAFSDANEHLEASVSGSAEAAVRLVDLEGPEAMEPIEVDGSPQATLPGLVLKRVRCETLNDSLWRWLCVLVNT